jgi:hypothetical protein
MQQDTHITSHALKVGLLLDSSFVPGWVSYLIDQLCACRSINPVLILLNGEPRAPFHTGDAPLVLRAWMAVDRWLRRSNTDALTSRHLNSLRNNCSIVLMPLVGCRVTSTSQADLEPLKQADCELLLYIGSAIPSAEVSACARLGLWSLYDHYSPRTRGVPGLFRDMYEGNRCSRYAPQVIEWKQDRRRTVYRPSVITSYLSLALNQNAAYWEIADVLVERLTETKWLRRELPPSGFATGETPQAVPGNIGVAAFILRWVMRVIHHEFRKRLFREQWAMIVQPNDGVATRRAVQDCRIIRPPKSGFYADPFLIERNGNDYLFFEDYSFSSRKGIISFCKLDDQGNCGEPTVVLERNYHLSYPFLFTWREQVYMIPETRDNRSIELYRAQEFPNSWVLEKVLMSDVFATDTTLLYHEQKWWLFTAGMREHSSPNSSLWLFFADSPLGPWTPHPKNPIVSDPTCARPAGALFFANGDLVRPGQDCSTDYGHAIHLHRVSVLSETEYAETLIERIPADEIRDCIGIHTVNQSAAYWVMDCKFLMCRITIKRLSQLFKRPRAKIETVNSCSWRTAKTAR